MSIERQNDIIDILFADEVPPDWAVHGFFLQGAIYTIGGEPGAGKSSLCYTLAIAAATGVSALSGIVPPIEPKRVLYFDEENSPQDRIKYIRWAWHGLVKLNGAEPDLGLLMENLWCVSDELGGDDWQEKLAMWVDFVQPHIIIFDTANPCFNIQDENSNSEASLVIKQLRRALKRIDPAVTAIILKHAKIRVDGTMRTLRGAKAWQGAVDGVVFQVKAPGRPKRDGLSLTRIEPGKTRAYGLRNRVYITPEWTNTTRDGLMLHGNDKASLLHKAAEEEEEAKANKD